MGGSRVVPVVGLLAPGDLGDVGRGQGTADNLAEDDQDLEEAEDEQLRFELALVHPAQDLQTALGVDQVTDRPGMYLCV